MHFFGLNYWSDKRDGIFRAAAEAAMARVQKKDSRQFNTSFAAIQAQVRRELEAEKKAKLEADQPSEQKPVEIDRSNMAVQGMFPGPFIIIDISNH